MKTLPDKFYRHSGQLSPLTEAVVREWGGGGQDSVEILFQSFLQVAIVSRSGIGRDVHFLMFFIQYILCRPRRRPPSKVP